ncbi:MAG: hypothetical protein GY799_25305 [Desulfobulbaceae bacterium]|nr:hypothetical protein [Desulfobulbaceae bacterium]
MIAIDEKAIDTIVETTRQVNMINDDRSVLVVADENIRDYYVLIIGTYLQLTQENTNE